MTHHPCNAAELAASIAACGYAEFVTLRHLEWLSSRYGKCSVADSDWQQALELANPLQGTPFGALAAQAVPRNAAKRAQGRVEVPENSFR